MMTCKQVSESASQLIDADDATWWQLAKFRFHLFMCKHCRRFVAQLRLTIGVVQKNTHFIEPTEDEIDRIVEKLEKHSH